MMTGNDETLSVQAIEVCRNLNRKAAVECEKHGISLEDVTLGALYSAFDVARRLKAGDPHAAIEWLRTGADVIEQQLFTEAQK